MFSNHSSITTGPWSVDLSRKKDIANSKQYETICFISIQLLLSCPVFASPHGFNWRSMGSYSWTVAGNQA